MPRHTRGHGRANPTSPPTPKASTATVTYAKVECVCDVPNVVNFHDDEGPRCLKCGHFRRTRTIDSRRVLTYDALGKPHVKEVPA